jgi:hypothetical protein
MLFSTKKKNEKHWKKTLKQQQQQNTLQTKTLFW